MKKKMNPSCPTRTPSTDLVAPLAAPYYLVLHMGQAFKQFDELTAHLYLPPETRASIIRKVCDYPLFYPGKAARELVHPQEMEQFTVLRRMEDVHTLYTAFMVVFAQIEKERRVILSDRMPGYHDEFPYAIKQILPDAILFHHITDILD